jgi:hypothetical protein
MPAAVEAQPASLNPWRCARVAQLRVEPARARNDAPQHDLGPRRRTLCHTPTSPPPPPLARILGRPICGGQMRSRTPSYYVAYPPWTREPSSRRGPPRTRAPAAVGSKIHGAAAAFSFKSP